MPLLATMQNAASTVSNFANAILPPSNPLPDRSELLAQVSPLDMFALLYFLSAWVCYAYYADVIARRKTNLITTTFRYRHAWMRQMLKRENRMVDASMMGNLMRSISFFANTSILILFGVVTMFGYRDKATAMLENIPYASSNSILLWEIKIFLLLLVFVYAFFKYSWSLRQYNYASIFVGAAPMPYESTHLHNEIAKRGGRLIANAARHFNGGLRAYYFGLASLGWFIHPLALVISTTWVVVVVYRREFFSHTVRYLAGNAFVDAMFSGQTAPKQDNQPDEPQSPTA